MLIDWAKEVRIRFDNLPASFDVLCDQVKSRTEDKQFSPRLLVAHIRHRYTNYDNLLVYINDHSYSHAPGCAHEVLWNRVNAEIEKKLDKQYGGIWR